MGSYFVGTALSLKAGVSNSFSLGATSASWLLSKVVVSFPRSYSRGVKLIFTGGHISLMVAFKGPNVILGL